MYVERTSVDRRPRTHHVVFMQAFLGTRHGSPPEACHSRFFSLFPSCSISCSHSWSTSGSTKMGLYLPICDHRLSCPASGLLSHPGTFPSFSLAVILQEFGEALALGIKLRLKIRGCSYGLSLCGISYSIPLHSVQDHSRCFPRFSSFSAPHL